jgi:hypothetical protein
VIWRKDMKEFVGQDCQILLMGDADHLNYVITRNNKHCSVPFNVVMVNFEGREALSDDEYIVTSSVSSDDDE